MLGKQLAWVVAQKNNLSFTQSRDFVKNFYSGSRAIADQSVKAELDSVSSVTDMMYQHNVVKTFEQSFASWLTAQSSNFLYGLENFEITLNYARNFSQNGLDDTKAKKYIDMYVNNSTKELSKDDIKSIKLFYSAAQKYNLIEAQVEIPLDII